MNKPTHKACKNCMYCGIKHDTGISISRDIDGNGKEIVREERLIFAMYSCHLYPTSVPVESDHWCGQWSSKAFTGIEDT